MSLILDALRKLDREKSSRRKGGPNIASEILRPEQSPAKERTFRYIFPIGLTALFAAGLTYALVVGVGLPGKTPPPGPQVSPGANQAGGAAPAESDASSKSPSSEPASTPVLKRQAAAIPPSAISPGQPSPSAAGGPQAPARQDKADSLKTAAVEKPGSPVSASPPAPRPQVVSAPPVPGPSGDARSEAARTPVKSAAPAVSKVPGPPPAERRPSQAAAPQEAEAPRGDTRKPAVQASQETSSAPPSLKITGIVWNEEPSKRRAVVNGSFVSEGSMIEGVKVVEILPTEVRFLYKGQAFQVTVF